MTGPAKTIEAGFNLGFKEYKEKSGRVVFAPNDDPELPHSIAGIITGIVGLDNLAEWLFLIQSYHIWFL